MKKGIIKFKLKVIYKIVSNIVIKSAMIIIIIIILFWETKVKDEYLAYDLIKRNLHA